MVILDPLHASDNQRLDAGLRWLHDERSILRILHRYGSGLDGHLSAREWLDGFARDAEVVILLRGTEVARHRGHDELLAFQAAHRLGRAHRHLVVQPMVDVDGVRATASASFVLLGIGPAGPSLRAVGRYDDELGKDEDGSWRLRRRTIDVEARADDGQAASWESSRP